MNHRRTARHFVETARRAVIRAERERVAKFATDHYSELQVMKSAAGYYIGTLFWDAEYQFFCPGSRDSGYYATFADAQDVLVEHWTVGMAA